MVSCGGWKAVMSSIRWYNVTWYDALAYAVFGLGQNCQAKRNGKKLRAARMGAFTPGAIRRRIKRWLIDGNDVE